MGVSFIGGGNRSTRRKLLTWRKSLTNFITYCYIEYTSPWTGFELTTLMVIGIDCTGSCKSNYHTITTTTTPYIDNLFLQNKFFTSREYCYHHNLEYESLIWNTLSSTNCWNLSIALTFFFQLSCASSDMTFQLVEERHYLIEVEDTLFINCVYIFQITMLKQVALQMMMRSLLTIIG